MEFLAAATEAFGAIILRILIDSFVVRIVYDYDSLYCEALSFLDFYEKPSSGYFFLNILSYFLYYSIL